MLHHTDANLFAPVYLNYLKLLPEDSAQKAWQEISLAVAAAAKPVKFACTTALLVTFLGADIPVHPDGTAWGEIAIEAGEDALAASNSTPEAIELVKSVFITESEPNDDLLLNSHADDYLTSRRRYRERELRSPFDQSVYLAFSPGVGFRDTRVFGGRPVCRQIPAGDAPTGYRQRLSPSLGIRYSSACVFADLLAGVFGARHREEPPSSRPSYLDKYL